MHVCGVIMGGTRASAEIVSALLRQGQARGEFTVPDIKVFSTVMVAMIEGLIVRQVMGASLDLPESARGYAPP